MTDYTALKLNVNTSEISGGNDASNYNKNDGADIWGFGMRWQVDW
jgi:hypothetical protein